VLERRKDGAHDEYEVEGAVSDDAVGDVDVAAFRIPDIRCVHDGSLHRAANCDKSTVARFQGSASAALPTGLRSPALIPEPVRDRKAQTRD
jgi:hypothetical protein